MTELMIYEIDTNEGFLQFRIEIFNNIDGYIQDD
jgi:hypothetical protein